MPQRTPPPNPSLGTSPGGLGHLFAGFPDRLLEGESVVGLDVALKAGDVRAAKVFPPPTETNFAAAWLTGDLTECQAAAAAFAEAVVAVGRLPLER